MPWINMTLTEYFQWMEKPCGSNGIEIVYHTDMLLCSLVYVWVNFCTSHLIYSSIYLLAFKLFPAFFFLLRFMFANHEHNS